MSEKLPVPGKSPEQLKEERLENFRTILGMFGTTKAKGRFLSLCREYWTVRAVHDISLGDGENYHPSRKIEYSPQGRADTHNAIMDTIGRLAVQTKKYTPKQEMALRAFAEREEVAQAIREYILDEKDKDKDYLEDEDQPGSKTDPRKVSDVAYYHNLSHGE